MWCLYTWSCLDNLIIIRFSINCSTVICAPTVILTLSWEKPLVKPMAPGSISYHICFQSTFSCIFTFCIYIIKYQKYIYLILLSLSDLTFASGREGIDNPFITLVASSLFVCVGSWDLWGASYWIYTLCKGIFIPNMFWWLMTMLVRTNRVRLVLSEIHPLARDDFLPSVL